MCSVCEEAAAEIYRMLAVALTTETTVTERCKLPGCEWAVTGATHDLVGCLATWHVYEDHRDVWVKLFGYRPPVDPDPRTPEGQIAIVLRGLP